MSEHPKSPSTDPESVLHGELPQTLSLPVLRLREAVLFPGVSMPISAGRPGTLRAIERALKTPDKLVFAVAQRENIEKGRDAAFNTRELVRLKKDIPLDFNWETGTIGNMQPAVLAELNRQAGYKQLAKRMESLATKCAGDRIGGKLDKVIEGAKNIVRWNKELKSLTPFVVFQFLVVKPNEHQVEAVYKLANEIGIDHVALKTAQIYDYKSGSELIPTLDKYSRYQKMEDGTYSIKNE